MSCFFMKHLLKCFAKKHGIYLHEKSNIYANVAQKHMLKGGPLLGSGAINLLLKL